MMFALVARVMVLMMWSLGMAAMKKGEGGCCLVVAQVAPLRSEGCWALQCSPVNAIVGPASPLWHVKNNTSIGTSASTSPSGRSSAKHFLINLFIVAIEIRAIRGFLVSGGGLW